MLPEEMGGDSSLGVVGRVEAGLDVLAVSPIVTHGASLADDICHAVLVAPKIREELAERAEAQ